MFPALRHGDRVIAIPYRGQELHSGQIVLARHPSQPQLMIKRLSHRCRDGWWVLGDNPACSTDSRQFGALAPSAIVAVASEVAAAQQ